MLEGLVAAELLKQQTWTNAEFDLYHFRDRNGLEIDLVLEFAGGRILAIDVKASTSFRVTSSTSFEPCETIWVTVSSAASS